MEVCVGGYLLVSCLALGGALCAEGMGGYLAVSFLALAGMPPL